MQSPPLPRPPIAAGYAQADDGVNLYWRTVGSGPLIVCCNGVGVSTSFWKYIVAHYAPTNRVLLWDYRAHGRSDRGVDVSTADLSIGRHADDLRCILDAVGEDRAMLIGHSMGCQVVFEFHRRYRDRVLGMVPMLGSAGRTLETFFDFAGSPALFKLASQWMDRAGERAHFVVRPLLESPLAWVVAQRAALVDPDYCPQEDLLPYLSHIATLDLRIFLHAVLACNEHDAWDTLPDVRVPTLVVAAERDTFTPMWLSRKMATTIPGADFLILADGSHAALIEQPATIAHRIDRFIAERGVFSAPAG